MEINATSFIFFAPFVQRGRLPDVCAYSINHNGPNFSTSNRASAPQVPSCLDQGWISLGVHLQMLATSCQTEVESVGDSWLTLNDYRQKYLRRTIAFGEAFVGKTLFCLALTSSERQERSSPSPAMTTNTRTTIVK